MSYGVGDRVLCVRGGWGQLPNGHATYCPNIPHRGRLYTVRDLGSLMANDKVFIRLVELVNPIHKDAFGNDIEPVFSPEQFVPVRRTQTDISALRGLLNKEPGPAELMDWVQNEFDDAIRKILEDS
jgi:hypothetical protein